MKIMKKIALYFCLSASVLIGSCEKELEKNPTDKLSSATFWKTKLDYDMALAACYNTLQDYNLSTGIHDRDGLSDNGFDLFSYGNEQTINQGITASSGATDFWYNDGYKRLARYNIFLDKLATYTGTDMSEEVKLRYEAEVRLLRAWEYYRLYTFYGSVPLVTVPLTLETQNVPKAPAADIFKQVIVDTDFAIAHLPNATFTAGGGHLVKAAAQLLQARAYLYVAYDKHGNALPEMMNKVVELTTPIVNSKAYQLGKTYRGLFSYSLGEQDHNPEYLFAVNFLPPNNSKLGLWGATISTIQLYWNSVHVLPSLLEVYQFSDGTPFNPNDARVDNNYLYKNRDSRMAATVAKDSVHWEDGSSDAFDNNKTPLKYLFWKTCDLTEIRLSGGTKSQVSDLPINGKVPLMRYAEVLLNHAEALNEVGGPSLEVYKAVNEVRQRVDMPALPSGLNQTQMRAAIRYERRVELAFEGFRYDDIKRWRIAPQVLNGVFDTQITRHFEEKNYVWPIPEAEIRKNPALEQNPDYQ